MKDPNMAKRTASLEKSLQNCSLNHHHLHQQTQSITGVLTGGCDSSSSSSSVDDDCGGNNNNKQQEQNCELNSHASLPSYWEQCLDLKTGEIYYLNWRTGMRAKEDPRLTQQYNNNGGNYYSEENYDDDDESSFGSEVSSSGSFPSSSKQQHEEEEEMDVLVVAGCKRCLTYIMVPKHLENCPKCSTQLLHFDRPHHLP